MEQSPVAVQAGEGLHRAGTVHVAIIGNGIAGVTTTRELRKRGNGSTYFEMGIDVRWYAQRQEKIVRASCIGCGVCPAVCPRGVLALENGATHADRFEGSNSPARGFLGAVGIRKT